jgi:hypothetical protein
VCGCACCRTHARCPSFHHVAAVRMQTAARRSPLVWVACLEHVGSNRALGQRFSWRTSLTLQPAKLLAFVIMATVNSRASLLLVLGSCHPHSTHSLCNLASEHRRFSRVHSFTGESYKNYFDALNTDAVRTISRGRGEGNYVFYLKF